MAFFLHLSFIALLEKLSGEGHTDPTSKFREDVDSSCGAGYCDRYHMVVM